MCQAELRFDALTLHPDDASMVRLNEAAKPSFALARSRAIQSHDPALMPVAQKARRDLYVAMAVRMRNSIPPITPMHCSAPRSPHTTRRTPSSSASSRSGSAPSDGDGGQPVITLLRWFPGILRASLRGMPSSVPGSRQRSSDRRVRLALQGEPRTSRRKNPPEQDGPGQACRRCPPCQWNRACSYLPASDSPSTPSISDRTELNRRG